MRSRRKRLLLAALAALAMAVGAWFQLPPRPRAVLPPAMLMAEVAFAPDSSTLATDLCFYRDTSHYEASVSLWDSQTGDLLAEFHDMDHPGWLAGFSADGRSVVTAASDQVKVWDVRTLSLTASRPFPTSGGRLGWTCDGPDGRLVLVYGDRTGDPCKLWDPVTGNEATGRVLPPGLEPLSPTGGMMAAKDAKTLYLFEPGAESPLVKVPLNTRWIRQIAYAPAGILAAVDGGDVLVWEAGTGKIASFLTGGNYTNASLSRDGRLLAVHAAHDFWLPEQRSPVVDWLWSWFERWRTRQVRDELRVYHRASGWLLARFPGATEGTFSPDGKALAVISAEHIAVYDLPFRRPLLPVAALALGAAGVAYVLAGVPLFRRRKAV